MRHPSHERFAEGQLLTRPTMQWFYDHYLRSPADVEDWRVSPALAADLSGARLHPDRRQRRHVRRGRGVCPSAATARRRRAAPTAPDQIHGFLTMGKIVRAAGPGLDEVASAPRRAWAA